MRIISLLTLLIFSSCGKYQSRPEIVGYIYGSNKLPLENVEIHFDDKSGDIVSEDKIMTDKTGRFVIKKMEHDYFIGRPGKYSRKYSSPKFYFKKQGYLSDTIDIRNYGEIEKIDLDTIYLNAIKVN